MMTRGALAHLPSESHRHASRTDLLRPAEKSIQAGEGMTRPGEDDDA
jgi:hypothetical protein